MNVDVLSLRWQLMKMPVFSHVPHDVHMRRAKYRRHYTSHHDQNFDFQTEVAALHRMRGAICFLCGELRGISLQAILDAPFEEHLCNQCQAALTFVINQHNTVEDQLKAIGRLPILRELWELCQALNGAMKYEHLRVTQDFDRGLARITLRQLETKRGPSTRPRGQITVGHSETGTTVSGDEPPAH